MFMSGMYWLAEAGETERIRTRDVSGIGAARVAVESVEGVVVVRRVVALLMYARARVMAPARAVVGVLSKLAGEVERRIRVRLAKRVLEIWAKGR